MTIELTFGLMFVVASCTFAPGAKGGDGATAPTVLVTTPLDGAIGVALDGTVSATFSEAMDPASLTTATFAVTSGFDAVAVPGGVTYTDSTVVFTPATQLTSDGEFTATITTEASSASGVALEEAHAWTFTGTHVVPGIPVSLGTAANYVVLTKAGISGITATVTGDLGVSPAAATYITGLSLIADTTNTFSRSAQVTGKIYAATYVAPTPALLTAAVTDMEVAFVAAGARTPDVTELGAGTIGGLAIPPGVYHWSTGVTLSTNLTLNGSASAVWIFQVAQDLTLAGGVQITLTGGALPKNVFWQVVGGPVTLAASAHLEGTVLAQTAVTLAAGASIKGKLLAQTSADIDGSTVVDSGL